MTPASADDLRWMARAVDLALHGDRRVRPNPLVGCVLVRGGEVVGEGHHAQVGGPHAEANALRQAGDRARGATAYVTLEPCAHQGRTPACATALIEAGVARVVIGVPDPNASAAGGAALLRAAGIDVTIGVLADACERAAEVFLCNIRERRAFVRLKLASTLDGRTAASDGTSRWITGQAARERVHRLREQADAVLIGSGTVLADDPQLDVRHVATDRQPLRVVLDRRLRTPVTACVADTSRQATRLYFTESAARAAHPDAATLSAKIKAFGDAGVRCVALDDGCAASHSELRAVLADLLDDGICSLLAEPGATLAGALIAAGLVDRLDVVLAGKLLGTGRPLLGDLGIASIGDAIGLTIDDADRLGEDLWITARPRARSAATT